MNLEEENKKLKKQLALSKNFIEREILTHQKIIASQKIAHNTEKKKKNFFKKDLQNITQTRFENFVGEMIYSQLDKTFIDYIVGAEILYYNVAKDNSTDGFAVLSSYFKAIDFFIEQEITRPFRKFAQKEHKRLVRNDLVEKNLNRVIYEGHSLSFGRLYQVLKLLPEEIPQGSYSELFFRFLQSYNYIAEVLTDHNFLNLYSKIIESEANSKKRHIDSIDVSDMIYIRNILIGDMKDKDSFIYKFVQMKDII